MTFPYSRNYSSGWQDSPSTATPIQAVHLEKYEAAHKLALLLLAEDYLVVDDFDRTDSDSPGSALTGQAWTEQAGDVDISSNKLVCIGTSTGTIDAASPNVDQTVRVTYAGGSPGLVLRSENNNLNRLQVQLDSTNEVRLQSVRSGAGPVKIAGPAVSAFVTSQVYKLRVAAYSEIVRVWLDDVPVLHHVLIGADYTDFSTNTYIGVRTTSSGGTFEDLRARRSQPPDDASAVKAISGAYTVTAADIGRTLVQSDTGVITVPGNVLPPGAAVYLLTAGSSPGSVAAGTGLTSLRNVGSLGAQYTTRTLLAISPTEVWLL